MFFVLICVQSPCTKFEEIYVHVIPCQIYYNCKQGTILRYNFTYVKHVSLNLRTNHTLYINIWKYAVFL